MKRPPQSSESGEETEREKSIEQEEDIFLGGNFSVGFRESCGGGGGGGGG